jgi:dihydroorotate dehydrogenase (fumarate)
LPGYLGVLREAKRRSTVPVIASLSCQSVAGWTTAAAAIEDAGADALELNFSVPPALTGGFSTEIEELYSIVTEAVCNAVDIPVAVKLGVPFTAMTRMAHDLDMRGASALVLFNRFQSIDIDVQNVTLRRGSPRSSPEEVLPALQWIALLYGGLGCDLCGSTGVQTAAGAVKMLLVGAAAVQVCSALYDRGLEAIAQIGSGIETWMWEHGCGSIRHFRGRLSQQSSGDPGFYERQQYV